MTELDELRQWESGGRCCCGQAPTEAEADGSRGREGIGLLQGRSSCASEMTENV